MALWHCDHDNHISLADEPITTQPNLAAPLLCVVPARPHGLWPPYAVLPVVSGHQALLWQESIKLARADGYGITPNVITATCCICRTAWCMIDAHTHTMHTLGVSTCV
jgi:hypothetical protein